MLWAEVAPPSQGALGSPTALFLLPFRGPLESSLRTQKTFPLLRQHPGQQKCCFLRPVMVKGPVSQKSLSSAAQSCSAAVERAQNAAARSHCRSSSAVASQNFKLPFKILEQFLSARERGHLLLTVGLVCCPVSPQWLCGGAAWKGLGHSRTRLLKGDAPKHKLFINISECLLI